MSPTLSNELPAVVFHHLKRKLPVWHVPALAFYFEIKPEITSPPPDEAETKTAAPLPVVPWPADPTSDQGGEIIRHHDHQRSGYEQEII